MLEGDAANHRWIERAVRERPIGYGERRILGSDQGSRGQQADGPAHHEKGVAMYARMIGGFHEFRAPSPEIWIIAQRKRERVPSRRTLNPFGVRLGLSFEGRLGATFSPATPPSDCHSACPERSRRDRSAAAFSLPHHHPIVIPTGAARSSPPRRFVARRAA